MVTFANFSLLWVSKLQTDISLYTLQSEYIALSRYGRALIPLKTLIKEVIDTLGIDSEKLEFLLSSNVYEDNNGAIVVATILRMTPTSRQISVKYHWFSQHVGNGFFIREIESKNQRANIFTKSLQGGIFVRIGKLLFGW